MDSDCNRPHHRPETEFTGILQEFSGKMLSPDDPSLEPRTRKGRPNYPQQGDDSDQADDSPKK